MALDPTRMRFSMSEPRPLKDDEENSGINCWGCIFKRQKASVCEVAAAEAVARGYRDCDAIDQFGEVIVYVKYYQRQLEIEI
jgi:hypothetical protein